MDWLPKGSRRFGVATHDDAAVPRGSSPFISSPTVQLLPLPICFHAVPSSFVFCFFAFVHIIQCFYFSPCHKSAICWPDQPVVSDTYDNTPCNLTATGIPSARCVSADRSSGNGFCFSASGYNIPGRLYRYYLEFRRMLSELQKWYQVFPSRF